MAIVVLILSACASPQAATDVPDTGAQATSAPVIEATATTAATAMPDTSGEEAAMEAEINVATDPDLGEILVGSEGRVLYMFKKDAPNQSNCDEGCLANWPPLLTQGSPVSGEGVDASLIGTADLADGTQIVTYNEMPLYYFAGDAQPGDTNGQGVGDVWFVVTPEGSAVESMAAEATEAPTAMPDTSGEGAAMEAEINVATDPVLGEILVGSDGRVLYMFKKDAPNQSNCSGECLTNWPPLLTLGSPTLGEGVDASLIGTADLADGTQIVTYNEMPLYYFAGDAQPGDTNGQGVGGNWFVVTPEGTTVEQ